METCDVKNILVLEDEERRAIEIMQSLARTFPAAEITHVANVSDARDEIRLHSFDLITVDGRLPETSGGLISVQAGNLFIDQLETLGYRGHTVMFSGEPDEVAAARRKTINGKGVGGVEKGMRHDSVSDVELLAQQCLVLIQ